MRSFWLFRSNIKELEYYHEFKDLETFEKKCHDYYMLFPLWFLKENFFDEVTIWRLSNKYIDPIIFDVNGKKYIQRWCLDFSQILSFPDPDMSFWRGGFKNYDEITKPFPKRFGIKIYLGAGQRINAQWGGNYDLFLMEDDLDIKNNPKTIPFYKTASPFIFHPLNLEKKWDICWPCNCTQLKYKGQEFFIKEISKSKELKQLKIVHCGNKPEIGKKLCKQYGVNNIEFLGLQERSQLNIILNSSKIGLNLSNRLDGCPRVSTEILMSGTPLVISNQTRLLSYYKRKGVIEVNDKNLSEKIISSVKNYNDIGKEVLKSINNELSFDNITKKNIDLWLLKKYRSSRSIFFPSVS